MGFPSALLTLLIPTPFYLSSFPNASLLLLPSLASVASNILYFFFEI